MDEMRLYRTNKRIWAGASLALFLPGWFVPIFMGEIPPWMLIPAMFVDRDHLSETAGFVGMFLIAFGVPAVVLGWVVQCLIVIVRAKFRERELG
jgi:hypothetical protein